MNPSLLAPVVLAALSTGLPAQWSSTASSNLLVADGAAEQAQPKLAPTADGGCYVSFFDSDAAGSPPFGFDVRLQRLDAAGVEQWAHGGVLVADRGFSSTQDYDLDVDPITGDALLAFRDDRPTGTQITAARVSPAGVLLWGPGGVQLTATTDFVAAPKIAATTDVGAVVAWAQNADVRLRKLDVAGNPVWPVDTVLTPPSGSYAASDLQASDAGSAILAIQFSTGGFTSPRHLLAQKLDSAGSPVWGASPVAVFDGGSLQFGNFPTFVPDDSGGAVFGWYSLSPSLECFAQRVLANGTELYPHNGIAASTDGSRMRVQPDVAFDPASQEVFLVYIEQSGSQDGVSAQRFDAAGTRLWTPTGSAILPLSSADVTGVRGTLTPDGPMAFWTQQPGFAQAQVRGATLDAASGMAVGPIFPVSSASATKFRLQAAPSAYGFAIVAWQDEGSGSADIAVQNVLTDGTLGGLATATSRTGTGLNPTCYTNVALPQLGGTWTTEVAHAPGAIFTATILHGLPATGPVIPGLGEALLDYASVFIYANTVLSTGTVDTHTLPVPVNAGIIGLFFPTQALVVDAGGNAQFCNAIDITVGL